MKEQFLNHSLQFITTNQTSFNNIEDEEKLLYGLEGLYLSITKLVFILALSLLLNFFKQFLTVLVFFNALRFFGFGFHASTSKTCLCFSTILILGLPYIIWNVSPSIYLKFFLCLFSSFIFIIYAPADTQKRPLTNQRKRSIRKLCASSFAILYSYFILTISNIQMSNLIFSSLLIETILILPITYKVFREPYRNYKMI